MTAALVSESEALHRRVRAFARGEQIETFDALALAIADHQARWSPGMRRLQGAHPSPTRADEIPALPADAFRVARVAVHPAELDVARFETSGTTSAQTGTHAFRTTETYRELSLRWGERALASAHPGPRVVVALAPDPGEPGTSSLGFMLRAFMERFDGRPRSRWLVSDAGVDLAGLRRAVETAEPLLVLATSFALVALLDALGGERLETPDDTVVMQTGGFKGRSREVDPAELRARVASALGIDEARVVGEYGMTELTSQLYEGTLPGGQLSGPAGAYLPPPWLRVSAVDPESLAPLPEGSVGLARFVDLGNVDSAVAIVTQDLVRRIGAGIELAGRREGAPPRGCSLALEALVS